MTILGKLNFNRRYFYKSIQPRRDGGMVCARRAPFTPAYEEVAQVDQLSALGHCRLETRFSVLV